MRHEAIPSDVARRLNKKGVEVVHVRYRQEMTVGHEDGLIDVGTGQKETIAHIEAWIRIKEYERERRELKRDRLGWWMLVTAFLSVVATVAAVVATVAPEAVRSSFEAVRSSFSAAWHWTISAVSRWMSGAGC